MKRQEPIASRWPVAAGIFLFIGLLAASADVNTRYESIVERNPFQLRPESHPITVENVPPATPPPRAIVQLTGVTSILSSKKALLEIIPGPGQQMIKPVLAEGERIDSVEVVSIDVEKSQVVIRNNGLVTNLTFQVAKAALASAGPGSVHPQPNPPVGVARPTVPNANTAPNESTRPTRGKSPVIVTSGNPSYQETAPSGLVPPRTIRPGEQPVQSDRASNAVDPAQAYLNMKAQAEWAKQHRVVMPPPPL